MGVLWGAWGIMDCFRALAICREDSSDVSFLYYHGSMWRNVGMGGDTEIGVVISGRIWVLWLCFIDTPVSVWF